MKKLHVVLKYILCVLSLSMTLQAQAAYNGKPMMPVQISWETQNQLHLSDDMVSDYYYYYAITTAEELYGFSYHVYNEGYAQAVLLCDIVVNDNLLDDEGNVIPAAPGQRLYSWFPIGGNKAFSGVFDGNGHTISGLYFDGAESRMGLFANVSSYTDQYGDKTVPHITNVHLRDSYFSSKRDGTTVAGLAATTYEAHIDSCSVADVTLCAVEDGYTMVNAAGLVGHMDNTYVNSCYTAVRFSGEVTSRVLYSGFGNATNDCKVSNSFYLYGDNGVDKQGKITGVTGVTRQQMTEGYVCYYLNEGSTVYPLWRQNLDPYFGTDPYPVASSSHKTVYQTAPCPRYTNISTDLSRYHSYDDETEECLYCDASLLASSYTVGSQTYYRIRNVSQLYWFADKVNESDAVLSAVLMRDLVINKEVIANRTSDSFRAWTPIGTDYKHPFRGVFDGQGHSISGLYIDASEATTGGNYGFIGYASSATVQNLHLLDSYIYHRASDDCTGVLAGYAYSSYFSNVSTQVYIQSAYRRTTASSYYGVGGMIGNASTCHLFDCSSEGYINSTFTGTGGIIGSVTKSGQNNLTRCLSSVKIYGGSGSYTYMGAIIGNHSSTAIGTTDCYYIKGLVTDGSGFVQNALGYPETGRSQSDANGLHGVDPDSPLSGGVAFAFNNKVTDGSQYWYQNIDNGQTPDVLPVLDASHGTIYDTSPCPSGSYSNSLVTLEHVAGSDRICTNCHQLVEPVFSADGYYLFDSTLDFEWLRQNLKDFQTDGIKIRLTADIDFSGETFLPIGSESVPFVGTFEGQGHTISGVSFTDADVTTKRNGFFGMISGSSECRSSVSGLHLDSSCSFVSTKSANYIGALAGYISYTTISDCLSEAYTTIAWSSEAPFMVEGCSSGRIYRCISRIKDSGDWAYYDQAFYNDAHKTDDAKLASGEICFLFNNGVTDGTQLWYQNLYSGTPDPRPTLDATHHTVHTSLPCPVSYTDIDSHVAHGEGADGICPACGGYLTPSLSADGYYEIATANDLRWISGTEAQAIPDIKLRLTADIDFGSNTLTPRRSMLGELDGAGHTLSNFFISSSAEGPVGLFCTLGQGGYVHDLILKGCVSGSNLVSCEGMIAGEMQGATIEHCGVHGNLYHYNTALNTSSQRGTGMLVGHSSGGNVIRSCYTDMGLTCKGGNPWEAIIGVADESDLLERCFYMDHLDETFSSQQASYYSYNSQYHGVLCYLLNDSVTDGTQAWYQKMPSYQWAEDGDEYPTLDPSHGTVYKGVGCLIGYTNSASDAAREHTYDADGYCTYCSAPRAPQQDAEGWYLISSPRDLYWMSFITNHDYSLAYGMKARLTQDIDMFANTRSWVSIYLDEGDFDGAGHAIRGLEQEIAQDDDSRYYAGFFGYIYGTYVHDLLLLDCSITDNANYDDGVLAAECEACTIERCVVNGSVCNNCSSDDGSGGTGLLVGQSYGDNVFSDCLVMGSITVGARCFYSALVACSNSSDSFSYCAVEGMLPYDTQYGTGFTLEQIQQGFACVFLNEADAAHGPHWYQNIDNGQPQDSIPTLDATHGIVYHGEGCFSGCTNLPELLDRQHAYDEDGICTLCGATADPVQDAEGYYLLSRISDFFWWYQIGDEMASLYPDGLKLRLTRDLDFSEMEGWPILYLYNAEFDGQGHTITGIHSSASDGWTNGFIACAQDANIHDLMLRDCSFTSSIMTDDGGLIADCYDDVTIRRCLVDVNVSNTYDYSSDDPDDDDYGTGVLIGYLNSSDVWISDCLVLGEASATVRKNVDPIFGYKVSGCYPSVDDCYKLLTARYYEGSVTEAEQLADGSLCYSLNDYNASESSIHWYQNLDNGETPDAYPTLDSTHGKVYQTSPCPYYTNQPGVTRLHNYGDDHACTQCGVTIVVPEQDAEGWYLLDEADKVYWFANEVNTGNNVIKGRLTSSSIYLSGLGMPIGTREYPFRGQFDGAGYSLQDILITQQGEDSYAGLFGYVEGTADAPVRISNLSVGSASLTAHTVGSLAAFATYTVLDQITVQYARNSAPDGIVGGIIGEGSHVSFTDVHVCDSHLQGDLMTGGVLGHDADGTCTISHALVQTNWTDPSLGTSAAISPDAAAISDCYYSNAASSEYGATAITPWHDERAAEVSDLDLYSGYLCYLLNDRQLGEEAVWGQILNGADYGPMIHSLRVYISAGCLFCNSGQYHSYLTDAIDYPVTADEWVKVPCYSRQSTSEWGTVCLPFEFYTSSDDCKLYTVSSIDNQSGTIYFSPATTKTIQPWQPVIFRCSGETRVQFFGEAQRKIVDEARQTGDSVVSQTLLKAAPASISEAVNSSITLCGSDRTQTIDPTADEYADRSLYYLSGSTLWHAVKAFRVRPFRVWFELLANESGAPARLNIESVESGETDLHFVIDEDGQQTDITRDLLGRPSSSEIRGLRIEGKRLLFRP